MGFSTANSSGAMDVVVAETADGKLLSTSFHVVFSRFRSLHPKDKIVFLRVNGQSIPVRMKLSEKGVGYFDAATCAHDHCPAEAAPLLADEVEDCAPLPPSLAALDELPGAQLPLQAHTFADAPQRKSSGWKLICRTFSLCEARGQDGPVAEQTSLGDRLRPSHETLVAFGLKPGPNAIEFVCAGNFGQPCTVRSCVYLYPHSDNRRIVVSDIDGTITRSDVRGHLLGLMSINYLHDSVCALYSELDRRGYTMVYLTARPLALADSTQRYLSSAAQRDARLPRGPLLLSADSVFLSFKREFYHRTTDVFKADCLRDLARVFGCAEGGRLFAGFGNRDKDTAAYRRAGIAPHCIFEMRERGALRSPASGEELSYCALHARVDELFPCVAGAAATRK